jgi:hypothetical protein
MATPSGTNPPASTPQLYLGSLCCNAPPLLPQASITRSSRAAPQSSSTTRSPAATLPRLCTGIRCQFRSSPAAQLLVPTFSTDAPPSPPSPAGHAAYSAAAYSWGPEAVVLVSARCDGAVCCAVIVGAGFFCGCGGGGGGGGVRHHDLLTYAPAATTSKSSTFMSPLALHISPCATSISNAGPLNNLPSNPKPLLLTPRPGSPIRF